MRFWRLYDERYSAPLSGEGARRFGGRWNPKGLPALYLGETASVTVLEVLVHAPKLQQAPGFCLAILEIDARRLPQFDPAALPEGWNHQPATAASREFGRRRLQEDGLLGFRVPSVIVPYETIAVINPEHPEFAKRVSVVESGIAFPIDPRLFAG